MSKCTCGHNHNLTANASAERSLRLDPTRTTTLRAKMLADVSRRFRLLQKEITQAVEVQDCFGLKENNHSLLTNVAPKQFAFTRSADKVSGFMSWLKTMEDQNILTTTTKPGGLGKGTEEAWTNIYISSAYQQGIRRAGQELKKAGIDVPIPAGTMGVDPITLAFNNPVHADRVGLLYTRSFNELKGITNAMDQQISSVLAQGLAEGRNPKEIARILNERVEGIGIARARTMARTEIVRAHHLASVQEYRNAGLLGVKIKSEWLTAGFNVCPACSALERKVFTLDEIENKIPAHPNCRCCAIPHLGDAEKEKPKPPVKEKAISPEQRLKEWESAKEAMYAPGEMTYDARQLLKQMERSSYYRYMEVAPKDVYDAEKWKTISSMLDRAHHLAIELRLKEAAEYIPLELLDELKSKGNKIVYSAATVRESFSPSKNLVRVNPFSTSEIIAHELGHAIDFNFSGGTDTGGLWKDLNNKFTTNQEGIDFTSWFHKQHSGKIGAYANGDGNYYKGNWMNDYEGRIYPGSGVGDEWWAMNIQRYSKYRVKRDIQYPKLIRDFEYLATLPEGEGMDKMIAELKKEGPAAWAARNSDWQQAKKSYPELTTFIENKFGGRTIGKY